LIAEWQVIALIVPLGLDTFAISAAIGVAGVDPKHRLRLSLVFAAFEGLMPLIGFVVGASIGSAIGDNADYVAGILLIALGGYMLREDADGEVEAASSMTRAHGMALIGLGVSVSLDELAIGFSAGLLGVSILAAAIIIAAQAFLMTQIGVRVGARVGEEVREGAERLAGVALILLGVFFIAAKAL
jgi:putative Mn2+ efflux pump MntP